MPQLWRIFLTHHRGGECNAEVLRSEAHGPLRGVSRLSRGVCHEHGELPYPCNAARLLTTSLWPKLHESALSYASTVAAS